MTITICNAKGGAGKTTVAVLLTLALKQCGKAATLVDRDPQGTSRRWMETVGENGDGGPSNPSAITVIDTPPNLDTPLLAQSLQEADLAILVSSASPADLWTSQDTVEIIRTNLRPEKTARLLFNQIQRRTLLGRDLEHLSAQIGLPSLAQHLSRRQVYQHAALLGWGALDIAAREEMLALVREILFLFPDRHDEEGRPAGEA